MRPSGPKKQPSRVSDVTVTSKSRSSRQDGDFDGFRGKTLFKPDDQLQLTEAELQEEIARVLTVRNTRIPDSLVEWSWNERQFVKLPDPPNVITLLSVPGTLLHKDSEEAKIQMTGGLPGESFDKSEEIENIGDEGKEDEEEKEEEEEAQLDEEEAEEQDKTVETTADVEVDDEEVEKEKPKKLPNQFNFCERAALTYDNPFRDVSTQTIPPPTETFNTDVLQWTIFDAYQEDFAQQQKEKEKERKVPLPLSKKEDIRKRSQIESGEISSKMQQSAKILERMVMQNIFNDVAQDYRYWDDPSDEFKDGEGSLLPLWKFQYEKTKKYDVTDLCFNSRYYDLFAVSFGTMSFDNAVSSIGYVCLFTLKNPSYPEWICSVDSPVMCLDFSVQHPHLLVIGTMDGSVAVYNVILLSNSPQYKSNEVTQKHGGIIWQVCWAPDTEEGNLAFYSVSVDGKIKYWILNQNDLGVTTIMSLFLNIPPVAGPDGTTITLKACGTCIAFHPQDPNIFLVGTEEGTIYKCNTAYSSIYMQTYDEAHNMPVYRIVFNKYNSNIFASCSGDWRIKIWEADRPEPLFMFDLGVPIGDVQWAPYSSTVLACVSNDGKVTVFDLNVNKYRPICNQTVVSKKKSKLTRIKFNNKLPFIIVGDDKGNVTSFKLSPNLRKTVKPTKKQLHLSQTDLECMKLERLLSFVREPPVLTRPQDIRNVQT